MTSIQVIHRLTANLNLEPKQIDVKIAFFHEDMEEEIYMEQLEGFEAPR